MLSIIKYDYSLSFNFPKICCFELNEITFGDFPNKKQIFWLSFLDFFNFTSFIFLGDILFLLEYNNLLFVTLDLICFVGLFPFSHIFKLLHKVFKYSPERFCLGNIKNVLDCFDTFLIE